MTHFEGLNILGMVKKARVFPDLFERTDVTIVFTLAIDDAGYVLGNKSSPLQKTALDLTGATVSLIAQRIPFKPSVALLAAGYSGHFLERLFTITGTLTDAVNGEVTFDLTPTNLDGIGEFLLEIQIKTATDKLIIPIQYRFQLRPQIGRN